MAETDIKDKNNTAVGKINLPEKVFGVQAKQGVMHEAVKSFLANQRQGTHATKTRGMVSGGGKKPWKQKHTGRARAGSSRSPLWRTGGTVFGPQPRDYSIELPKKMKKAALYAVLSAKVTDGEMIVLDDIDINKPRTKELVSILSNVGIEGETALIVMPEKNDPVILSARNIPGVTVRRVTDLNAYEVAVHRKLVMTKKAIEMLSGAVTK